MFSSIITWLCSSNSSWLNLINSCNLDFLSISSNKGWARYYILMLINSCCVLMKMIQKGKRRNRDGKYRIEKMSREVNHRREWSSKKIGEEERMGRERYSCNSHLNLKLISFYTNEWLCGLHKMLGTQLPTKTKRT